MLLLVLDSVNRLILVGGPVSLFILTDTINVLKQIIPMPISKDCLELPPHHDRSQPPTQGLPTLT